ncbi:MAG TPA: OFA family MFS transporter [Candidatus Elarobacter sp.]|nr:OFA family MFS transporter [Candidatus Elarobacter sp.]
MATTTSAPRNRWAIAWAGVIVMILAGTAYAWSNFTQPLIAGFGWSSTQTSLIFGIAIFSLGIGAVVGGRWQDRVGPRTVTMTGIGLWGLGNLLAAVGPHEVWWWDLTYGIIGGFGNGMAYITPVATVTKWFPDKRGLASGMVVMGFGLGAFFYGFILKAIPGFVAASKHAGAFADAKTAALKAGTPFDPTAFALTPDDIGAVMTVLMISGIVYAIVGVAAASFLQNPPAGYSVGGAVAATASHQGSYTPAQVLRTPQFYLLWLMLFVNVVAGILIVSNAVPIIRELISKGVTDPTAIKALTGTAISAYAFVAVFNGLGRFFWGAVSDRIGRNMTWVCIYGAQAVIFFLLPNFHSVALVLFAFAIILACYGGGFGTMPSFNADYFGTRFLGQNYGYIITAWGLAGLVGPYIAGAVKDRTGSFSGALVPMAIMLLVAIVLPFITKKPPPASATAA